jgi:hypothetical protein
MQLLKYETHAHTSEVSRCSRISSKELVRFYKECGYSGICITDHFLNGNTTVPAQLPWAERVELFCRGYEGGYEEGKRIGIDVFFGWEYSYMGTDLLTYGLDKKWLLDHPESIRFDVNEYCDLVHEYGGFIVHAHPFREADYIAMIRLLPRKVDAIETVNACRTDFENKLADQYADNYHLLKSAGSDNHAGMLARLSGLKLVEPLSGIQDMISAIKAGRMEIFSDCNVELL